MTTRVKTQETVIDKVAERVGWSRRQPAPSDRWIKRALDVIGSLVGLLVLAPFFLLIAILIKRDSKGPVFYRGRRMGYQGRTFNILKFRTMYEQPQSYQGPPVTAHDDPRVTRVGRWLRARKLNELPQLWNVLKGEMSLVGPRPEDPRIGENWSPEARREVLSVRPGITSPASVLYRDEENWLVSKEVMQAYLESILPSKLRLDQIYVRHRSIWLDLDILLWTCLVLLPRLQEYQPAEEALFAGPFSRIYRQTLKWFVADVLVSLVAFSLSGVAWGLIGPLAETPFRSGSWLDFIGWSAGFALLIALSVSASGSIERLDWSQARFGALYKLLPPIALATLIYILVNRLLGGTEASLPPAMLLTASVLALLGCGLVRYRGRLITEIARHWLKLRGQARAAQERVLIIGGGETGQFAAWLLGGNRAGHFYLTGFVDDDLHKQRMPIAGLQVLGKRTDIPRLVEEMDIGILVFAIHNISQEERQRLLEVCASTPARVVHMPDILGAIERASRPDFSGANENDVISEANQRSRSLCMGENVECSDTWTEGQLDQTPISSPAIDAWLSGLAETAASGDLKALQEQIKSLRNRIKAGT